jgi:uncharacterized protein YeaO (DUF488 family)
MISIKRAYESADSRDGERILVDRLWPRGLAKKDAAIDVWVREVAPTKELRMWFNHRPELFNEFRERYRGELTHNHAALDLARRISRRKVTLVYAARDPSHNHAVVLAQFLSDIIDQLSIASRKS